MNYALLIYGNEAAAEGAPAAAKDALMKEFDASTASILKAGKLRGGEAFQPTATATTVRLSNERVAATDGPFAKTGEQLGVVAVPRSGETTAPSSASRGTSRPTRARA